MIDYVELFSNPEAVATHQAQIPEGAHCHACNHLRALHRPGGKCIKKEGRCRHFIEEQWLVCQGCRHMHNQHVKNPDRSISCRAYLGKEGSNCCGCRSF